jgi:hypothetical protein
MTATDPRNLWGRTLNIYLYICVVCVNNWFLVIRSVGSYWATGWTVQRANLGTGKRLFSSPKRSDRLWSLTSLLLPGDNAAGALRRLLTTI